MFGVGPKLTAPELLSMCVCLLTPAGIIPGHADADPGPAVVKVVVKEGSDAILPCSLSTSESIESKVFDWKKDVQKEVFFYDGGIHYNNGRTGQDEQFRGRVSHFKDELKYSNASIIIRNTKETDSGNYTCIFPRLQPERKFRIELVVVVELTFKDRSGESTGAAPEPYIRILNATEDGVLLQCEVGGASPKPKVEWRDSAGNILPAEEPQVSYRGDRYYVTLLITVSKSDRFRCVVQQEDIKHQTHAETYLPFYKDLSSKVVTGWLGGLVLGVLALAAVLALLKVTKRITLHCNKGSREQRNGSCNSVPLNSPV